MQHLSTEKEYMSDLFSTDRTKATNISGAKSGKYLKIPYGPISIDTHVLAKAA